VREAEVHGIVTAVPGGRVPAGSRGVWARGHVVSDGELWAGCAARRGVGVAICAGEHVRGAPWAVWHGCGAF